MGQIASQQKTEENSDLSEERVEEIRMITSRTCFFFVCCFEEPPPQEVLCILHEPSVPVKEIQRIRRKYRAIVQQEDMTKEEFYALPGIAMLSCMKMHVLSMEIEV